MASILTAALSVWLLARLAPQALRARLYTDECYHAYVSEWIAAHHRLPTVLPELYSGFSYYYPPLLHLLGAAWVATLGTDTLAALPLVLFAALVAGLAWWAVPDLAAAPRRWAILLCLANEWLALYAVRFYVEMLISVLALVATLTLWRFERTSRRRDAVVLGIATGLALVSKHTALGLLGAIVILALVSALRRRAHARGYAIASAIAFAIALPYFVRNFVRFGSPVYPAFARDTHGWVWRLNLERFSPPALPFFRDSLHAVGIPILVAVVLALAVSAVRRRASLALAILIGALVVLALGAAMPLHDVRHVTPLIPVIAVAACASVWPFAARRAWLARGIEAALLILAVVTVARLRDLRSGVDVPPGLEAAYAAARAVVPEGRTILSLWTYDTFYYSRRPATWPIPWAQRIHPIEPFMTHDPDRFEAALRQDGIDYILLPRTPPPATFNGVNYPKSLTDCVAALMRQGRMIMVWNSPGLALVGRAEIVRRAGS